MVDLFGHGCSTDFNVSENKLISLGEFVDQMLVALISHLGVSNLIIITHGSSCLVGIRLSFLYKEFPHMINGLILISPSFEEIYLNKFIISVMKSELDYKTQEIMIKQELEYG